MSVLNKKWEIKNTTEKSVVDKICENRGLSDPEDLAKFIKPDFENGFHDPFLIKGMDRACERIKKAIAEGERIIIFGDYDVDGISSAAILYLTLEHLKAKISYRLPHRVNDGYGLSEKYIREFVDIKVGLVVTVDCGVSNADEITLAKENGIDVIVTDHHRIPEKYPHDAYEIIHPNIPGSEYPFKDLTGAGVAFKLAQALLKDQPNNDLIFALLDLASLGTVADCGPIVGENRLIVKKGLEMLPQTKWEGLRNLQEVAGVNFDKPLNTHTIGYQIAPRINAAGRIDSPYFALQLLIQEGQTQTAKRLAKKLETLNKKRQDMLKKSLDEAEKRYLEFGQDDLVVMDYSPDWHVGIIGLIAGRLAEKYAKPAIIMHDFGDYLVGSARSQEYFNVIDAFTEFKRFFTHFGGHAQAAGFSINKDQVDNFIVEFKAYVKGKLEKCDITSSIKIDCEISAEELNWDTLEFIKSLEPFGIANQRPTFLLRNAEIEQTKVVGKDETHLSLNVRKEGKSVRGIAFNFGEHNDYARERGNLDIVFQLEENEWKGNSNLQLKVIDFS
ncbi:single-stranded-DNA-specific exonuclease RecJ [Patescibacteria group bacterium]